jgi:hypothetical protein
MRRESCLCMDRRGGCPLRPALLGLVACTWRIPGGVSTSHRAGSVPERATSGQGSENGARQKAHEPHARREIPMADNRQTMASFWAIFNGPGDESSLYSEHPLRALIDTAGEKAGRVPGCWGCYGAATLPARSMTNVKCLDAEKDNRRFYRGRRGAY